MCSSDLFIRAHPGDLPPILSGDFNASPDTAAIRIYETAGSGVITIASARLLLFDATSGKVFPAGIGTDADKGKLNVAGAFGETGTDQLRHQELLSYPGHSDGIQIALGTFGGTSPTFNVDLWLPSPRRWS